MLELLKTMENMCIIMWVYSCSVLKKANSNYGFSLKTFSSYLHWPHLTMFREDNPN